MQTHQNTPAQRKLKTLYKTVEFSTGRNIVWRTDNWQAEAFPEDTIISGRLSIGELTLATDSKLNNFSAQIGLQANELRLSDVRATWNNVPIRLQATTGLVAGVIWLNGSFELEPAVMYETTALGGWGAEVSFGGSLAIDGQFTARGTDFYSLASSMSGNGRLSIISGVISGISPVSLEESYFSAVRSSSLTEFVPVNLFARNETTNIGSAIGQWSVSDGVFRFSAPTSSEDAQRVSLDYNLADLSREIRIRLPLDDNKLPPYELVLKDVVSYISSQPVPMLALAEVSAVRQDLLVTITENNVLTLEELAVSDEEVEGGEQMEQIRTPDAVDEVSVEQLEDTIEENIEDTLENGEVNSQ